MPRFMAAATPERPVVVDQGQILDKASEIRAVATLLADLADLAGAGWDLSSTVVTLDALHTMRSTARTGVETGANYVMPVNASSRSSAPVQPGHERATRRGTIHPNRQFPPGVRDETIKKRSPNNEDLLKIGAGAAPARVCGIFEPYGHGAPRQPFLAAARRPRPRRLRRSTMRTTTDDPTTS
jgi:hypothetical protein